MAQVALHSLPLFVRLAGRPVILLGEGEAADAKRRLLGRAGALVVGEAADATLAIVAIDDEADALAAVARLKARGLLVNAVDRPDHCDFTLPAIVDRAPVLVAIGTGGVSAGLAAALRQRLEALLPAGLGRLAEALFAARGALRARYPDGGERRRAIAAMLAKGGPLDPLVDRSASLPFVLSEVEALSTPSLPFVLSEVEAFGQARTQGVTIPFDPSASLRTGFAQGERRVGGVEIILHSPDPDDLTLRQARALASADRVIHAPGVPAVILDRARADAARMPEPGEDGPGLTVRISMA